MKLFSAILLSLILLMHLVFTYGAYGILRFQAREAAEQKILRNMPDHELVQVVVNAGNRQDVSFSWFGNDEFSYKGHMYDVVRTKVDGSNTLYYCMDDTHEAALVDKLDKCLADAATSGQRPNNTQLLKTACKEYTVPQAIVFNNYFESFRYPEATLSLNGTSFSEIPGPPPKA